MRRVCVFLHRTSVRWGAGITKTRQLTLTQKAQSDKGSVHYTSTNFLRSPLYNLHSMVVCTVGEMWKTSTDLRKENNMIWCDKLIVQIQLLKMSGDTIDYDDLSTVPKTNPFLHSLQKVRLWQGVELNVSLHATTTAHRSTQPKQTQQENKPHQRSTHQTTLHFKPLQHT